MKSNLLKKNILNLKKEYKLKEFTSNISVSEGPNFFSNEEEAWNTLKRLLQKDQFGILYVLHQTELPVLNTECIKAFNKKYKTDKTTLFVMEWKPLFLGRSCDKFEGKLPE